MCEHEEESRSQPLILQKKGRLGQCKGAEKYSICKQKRRKIFKMRYGYISSMLTVTGIAQILLTDNN